MRGRPVAFEQLVAIIEDACDDVLEVRAEYSYEAWVENPHAFAVRCAERIAAAEHGSFRLTGDRGNTDRPKGGT